LCKPSFCTKIAAPARPNKILWATDYPHSDGFFPGAPKMILDPLEGVSPETRHGVVAGGAMGFYGLN
jgi:hypothetical protein